MGRAHGDDDKRWREGKEGGHERKEGRRGGGVGGGLIRSLYSSPFSMILLSYHGYKGNKKRGH